VTIDELQALKGVRKITALVCWDSNTARAADEAAIDLVSVGDSAAESLDELLAFCASVRRGVTRALVSFDVPEPSVETAKRLAAAGADMVKVEGIDHVRAIAAAGIPVFAQIEDASEAKPVEEAGAALLDFRHSGPDAGAEAVAAVSIPVLGGLGGGPWLDGRIRAVHRLLDLPAFVEDVRSARPLKGD